MIQSLFVCFSVDLCFLRKLVIPRSGVYHNAGVRLVPTKSLHSHEFLWSAQLPGSVLALRSVGLLDYLGQHHLGGSNGHGCWSYLLLPRGCLPKTARWFPNPEDAVVLVSAYSVFI